MKKNRDEVHLLSIYVDDGGVSTSDESEREGLMGFLSENFKMKD